MPDSADNANKKLKIVFIPKDSTQSSICNGLAQILTDHGHQVIIVVNAAEVTDKEQNVPGPSGQQNRRDKLNELAEIVEKEIEQATSTDSSAANEDKLGDDEVDQGISSDSVAVCDDKQGGAEIEQVKPTESAAANEEKQAGPEFQLYQSNKMCELKESEYEALVNLLNFSSPTILEDWVKFITKTITDIKKYYTSTSQKNNQLGVLISKYNPDIFVTDSSIEFESINKTKKPWVWLYSGNPLSLSGDTSLPPPNLGFPNNVGWGLWKIPRSLYNLYTKMPLRFLNMALMAGGNPFRLVTEGSPYLTIYGYPKELDYKSEWNSNFYRVDTFSPKIKLMKESLKIPNGKIPKLNSSQKLILVSMGNFHSANIKFMSTLLGYLSKSSHNFIIEKQFSPKEYELFHNMILLDNSLTKKQVIHATDLVITDGSDETVLDAFALGKPIIALPYWLAQLDNAQRLHELGYGVRLSPWTYSEGEILSAIEKLLNDKELNEKLSVISKRILDEDRLDKAAELIENLGIDKNFYRDD